MKFLLAMLTAKVTMKDFGYAVLFVLGGCSNSAPSAAVQLPAGPSNEGSGPATVGADVPIAAFGVNQCGGAVVLIVIVDDTHVLRFDMKQTTIFVRKPDGTVSEESGPPTPFKQAFQLAQSAAITSNATLPCGKPEVAT